MITINKMSLSDLENISSNLSIEFDDFWSYNTLYNELNNENSIYYCAKSEQEIVAFGGMWKSVDDIHITNIVVKKAFRKKGIATLLLEKLINEAKNLHYESITLEVNSKNIPAINLYTKFNFKNMGIRKNYYGIGCDAIIMTLIF